MLSRVAKQGVQVQVQRLGLSYTTLRTYSSEHKESHHGDEHHDDHHETPLAPAESIINKNTLTFAGIIGLIGGYYVLDSSYRSSNDNKSIVSILAQPSLIEEAKNNYDEYRSRVKKQTQIQQLITYPGEKINADTYIPRDTEVLGRLWASGSNTQFNTIQNWDELAPRKTKESPFY